ncbi:hypothetical protein DFH06DRAFT_1140470 [Mycena polygramma]|nr:hypothetical protein DFH06DRAFT_1140470 [Mycena polygramma]
MANEDSSESLRCKFLPPEPDPFNNYVQQATAQKIQGTNAPAAYFLKRSARTSTRPRSAREHVAAILSQTTAYVPSTDPIVLFQILVNIAKYARNLEDLLAVSTSASVDPSLSPSTNDSTSLKEEDGSDGVLVDLRITDPLRRLSLRAPISGADDRHSFFGKSSSLNFIKAAMQYAEGASNMFEAQRPEFWVVEPVGRFDSSNLIDIYFRHINPMFFLLHSPTFRAAVAEGKHLRDRTFGAVVLVVCALASRRSDDPEVLITPDAPVHSAGWKWFQQARPLQIAISSEISLYKLQLICVSVMFLGGTARPRSSWILAGLGMRLAQEMGAHRRSRYSTGPRLEGELLKRHKVKRAAGPHRLPSATRLFGIAHHQGTLIDSDR